MSNVIKTLEDGKKQQDSDERSYNEKFDGEKLDNFKMPPEKLRKSYGSLPAEEKEALETIRERIEDYQKTIKYTDQDDGEFKYVYHPLEKIGVYVPGGTAL